MCPQRARPFTRSRAIESPSRSPRIARDQARSKPAQAPVKLTLEEFFAQAEGEGPKELSVVLKADVQGTCEAVRDSLEKLSTDEVKLKVLSSGVGAISETDIMLAKASQAIVLGFHVRPDPSARRASDDAGVDVRTYTVIMELLDEVKAAMAGPAAAGPQGAHARSCRGQAGPSRFPRSERSRARWWSRARCFAAPTAGWCADGVQVCEGKLSSLRRFKDDVSEVQNGLECGIGIENYNDVKVGDEIEIFEVEEVPATL